MVHIDLTAWRLKPRLFINADGSSIAAHKVINDLGKLKKLSFAIEVCKSSFSFGLTACASAPDGWPRQIELCCYENDPFVAGRIGNSVMNQFA